MISKKKIEIVVILLFGLLFVNYVSAYPVIGGGPWKSSGSDSYIYSGNVGIGTTTPAEKLDVNGNIQANAFTLGGVYQNAAGLTHLLHPSQDGGYNDLYKAGWRPAFFNQQWGGAFGGEYPNGVSEEAWFETGYIEHNTASNTGSITGQTWRAQAFKVSQAITVDAVWLKLYKAGNPQKNTEPLEVHISSALNNGAGDTIVTNGNASAINGHNMSSASENWPITSNSNGEWYRFTFDTAPTLGENTTYYIVTKTTGADGTNYFKWMQDDSTPTYPYEYFWGGDDATPTTWTEYPGNTNSFLIESTSATQFIQSDTNLDIADSKYVFNEGLPLDQSKGLTQPLKNFFNDKEFTTTFRGVNFSKDKTIMDFLYGLDHDRIVLRADSNGYTQLTLYQKNESNHTITGTTDISDGSDYDIGLHVRMRGDGSDFMYLYVNGVVEASLTSQIFVMDDNFKDLGTAWLGGGFPLAPSWDENEQMNALPSAGNWAYDDEEADTSQEGQKMSVQNGKLYQNKNGFTTNTDYGYYMMSTQSLDNANGWMVVWKARINEDINTAGEISARVNIEDGAKVLSISMHEYYVETTSLGTNHKYQIDLTDKEHVFMLQAKGSDIFLWVDGKVIFDGTGLFTGVSGSNQVIFGDGDSNANSNADVIWDYIKYDESPWSPPQFTNASLHEFAFWSGNKSVLFPLIYNSGSRIAVKDFVGVDRNYMRGIKVRADNVGINSDTNTGTIEIDNDLSSFILIPNGEVSVSATALITQDTDQKFAYIKAYIDGVQMEAAFMKGYSYQTAAVGTNGRMTVNYGFSHKLFGGLHKVENWWASEDATSSLQKERTLIIEEK